MAAEQIAVIIGAGSGLSASLTRQCAARGMRVAMAARNPGKLEDLVTETGASAYQCDASDEQSVEQLFNALDTNLGTPDLVVYNPSYRTRGPVAELDPAEVKKTLLVSCYGGFLVGQAAARRMMAAGKGSIQFTGASASVKGYVNSAPFAMGKFGLRGLAQSMARELAPKNVHVAHFVIDGGIRRREPGESDNPDKTLDPEAIAQSYLAVHDQHRSAWTWEVELRPWVENF